MEWSGLEWICKTWSGFVKHGFVKGGFVKHGFVKGGFVKHGFVKGGFVKHGFVKHDNLKLNKGKTINFILFADPSSKQYQWYTFQIICSFLLHTFQTIHSLLLLLIHLTLTARKA